MTEEAKNPEVEPSPPKRIEWVAKSNGEITHSAFQGGFDSSPIYVARTAHAGGIIPGKLHLGHKFAHVPYNSQEFEKPDYELLVAPQGWLKWVPTEGRSLPQNALEAGSDPNGDPYFVGRVRYEDKMVVGKVHQRYGLCYIPYGCEELGFSKYEVLVERPPPPGRTHDKEEKK